MKKKNNNNKKLAYPSKVHINCMVGIDQRLSFCSIESFSSIFTKILSSPSDRTINRGPVSI